MRIADVVVGCYDCGRITAEAATMASTIQHGRASHTKIVATVGPASSSPEKLIELVHAGVDVFRINTAHGDPDDHARLMDLVRGAGAKAGIPVAVLVDLAGPKLRLGELCDGQLTCQIGDRVQFVRGDTTDEPGTLVCTYPTLIEELQPGDRVMLADGTVALEVEGVETDRAVCRVTQGGTLRNRQGVNLPGVRLKAEALNARDRKVAEWAAKAEADFISLSFVRRAEDVRQLRELVTGAGAPSQIVAKIEKPEALDNLEAIIAATDAAMVARGDLGVEIDIARMAAVQKQIVAECRRQRKPVIIATQMLDSMHHSRLPTRAEATDVANAILDGADACMLSGETAIGEYPVDAVQMMHRIALAIEPLMRGRARDLAECAPSDGLSPVTQATTCAAARIAEELNARMIIVATATGRSALCVSQARTLVPVIGVSTSPAVLRRMCLLWGVIPFGEAPAADDRQLLRFIVDRGRQSGELSAGDRIVLLTGTGLPSSRHNAVIVHEVE
jgi:pyruvate kinase